MDQGAQSSNLSLGQISTDKFGSLSLGRTYIDTVQQSVGLLDGDELIAALQRLDRAYEEFPELELDRPRRELLEGLRSTAENLPDRAAIPLLMYCVGQCCSAALVPLVEKIIKSDFRQLLPAVLRSVCGCRELCWGTIEPVVRLLRQQGRTETVLQLLSEVLGCLQLTKEGDVSQLGDVLKQLLGDRNQPGGDSAVLAQAAGSARSWLVHPSLGRDEPASRERWLAMAERLRPTRPEPYGEHAELGWPSGRISFDEFLIQWPCEIELQAELDGPAFVEEAYRAILLREPEIDERDQLLRLLQQGTVSKSWVIEELLASKELHSLERRVRVLCGGLVITDPGSPWEQQMPAVTWPCRSAR